MDAVAWIVVILGVSYVVSGVVLAAVRRPLRDVVPWAGSGAAAMAVMPLRPTPDVVWLGALAVLAAVAAWAAVLDRRHGNVAMVTADLGALAGALVGAGALLVG